MRSAAARWVALAAILGVGLLASGPVEAAGTRTESLRWAQANPGSVAGFRVHYGPASQRYDHSIDVGLPTPVKGVYHYDLQVPSGQDVYVAVTSYGNNGKSSPFSNEQLRAASSSGGGSTPPPSGGGGGSNPPPSGGGGGGSTPPPSGGGGGGSTPPPSGGGSGGTPPPSGGGGDGGGSANAPLGRPGRPLLVTE